MVSGSVDECLEGTGRRYRALGERGNRRLSA